MSRFSIILLFIVVLALILLLTFSNNRTMHLSNKGKKLIKSFEGFRSKPYYDTGGVATIGYGTTKYPNGKEVEINDASITRFQADKFFENDIAWAEEAVNDNVTSRINQHQFDALTSFVYNLGEPNFRRSTLLVLINNNPNNPEIKYEFLRWVHDDGIRLAGLVKRRKKEATLYFKPSLI